MYVEHISVISKIADTNGRKESGMFKTATLIICILISITVNAEQLKFGIASIVSPEESLNLYRELNDYLAGKLNKTITPVIKRDYDEMNRMITENEVDFASVCTGALPYLNNSRIRVLAVPEMNGKHSYQSFIIANTAYGINSVKDLKDKTFAFTDRLSNSGTLYPSFLTIRTFNQAPEKVYKKIYYTKSHDKSIYLVNKGVVQSAAVDSLIFEIIRKKDPQAVRNIRVIHRSPEMISPPFVAASGMNSATYDSLKYLMLNMHNDPKGAEILKKLHVDRFVNASVSDYKVISDMKAEIDRFYSGSKK